MDAPAVPPPSPTRSARRRTCAVGAIALALALVATACGDDDDPSAAGASTTAATAAGPTEPPRPTETTTGEAVPLPVATSSAADGTITVVAEGLSLPTQVADGPDGTLVVAQLGAGEDTQDGEVLVVDPATGTTHTLLEGLDKPTGVVWSDGTLWVMLRNSLTTRRLDGWRYAPAGPLEVVLDDLPFNGRSDGTLTLLPDGRVLYDTSAEVLQVHVGTDGSREPDVAAGAATVFAYDPATEQSTVVAIGTANAYGHAVLADSRFATTEVSDGSYLGGDPLSTR